MNQTNIKMIFLLNHQDHPNLKNGCLYKYSFDLFMKITTTRIHNPNPFMFCEVEKKCL